MKLRKLEIYGFKTFPQPTELTFHDGITAIVGPNGCGKSNIIDAIRWVMGEKSAKGLRADGMEDVIFAGCDSRKPLNFAEVTLTLGEVEGKLPEKFGSFHEVAVTRRLHRSGESEYLINKVPSRLRDIADLFLDTGLGRKAYSIVEQGRIDAILSAKPDDRRYLIEEAAGLSKYRARREETLQKVKQTSENLERLDDILAEVRRDMGALKRQATRALAFKELRAEKRGLERHTLVALWLDLSRRIDEARAEAERRRDALLEVRTAAEKLGSEIEERRLSLLGHEKSYEERQRKVYGFKNQIAERESRMQFLDREVSGLADRSARAVGEAGELATRFESIRAEIALHEEELAELESRLDGDTERLETLAAAHRSALEARRAADGAREAKKKEVFQLMAALGRVNTDLDHAQRGEKDAQRRRENLDRQEVEIAQKLGEVESESRRHEEELQSAENACKSARADKERLEEDLEDLALDREKTRARADELRRALHTEQSKLKGLDQVKQSLEWYGAGVKSYLRHAAEQKVVGVRGVVADAIRVPPEYEAALEAALGERLQYIVVADSAQAADGVLHLKETRAGRSSFIPVEVREPPAAAMPKIAEPWARGRLLDLVTVEPGNERLVRALLGDVFVVETLAQALDLWTRNGSSATFVTLDGEMVSPEGVVTGGKGSGEEAGLLRRNREIRELEALVKRHAADLEKAEEKLREVETEHADFTARLKIVRDEAHRQELRMAHVSSDVAQMKERRERLAERREAIEFERDELDREIQRLARLIRELEEKKSEAIRAQEAAAAEEETLALRLTDLAARVDAAQADLTRAQVQAASDRQRQGGLAQQIRTLAQSRDNVAHRAQRMRAEGDELARERSRRIEEAAAIRLEVDALRAELQRVESEVSEVLQHLDDHRGELSSREREAGDARRKAEETQTLSLEADMAVREAEIEAQSLAGRYAERGDGELAAEAAGGLPEGFDAAATAVRIAGLDDKIRAFGEINLLAVEEYEERKTRLEFLEGQRKDLEKSVDVLKRAIHRINRISRERFAQTFERVNTEFQAVFPKLFRGGEAMLFLTEPEDLLATGIDITVHPPGKRPQHISLLSGGEKALTAAALLFALFLVKPTPFCVLDEVDAPLDDANVERFTELLRQMAADSQFLVITHNKITMEAAAHLYGVTMEEPGISNLVSVRLGGPLAAVEAA